MNPATKRDVDRAIDVYYADYIPILYRNSVEAHIAGDITAYHMLKIPLVRNTVQQEALVYGKQYKKLLVDRGASIIKGKEVPWLAEHIQHTRDQAYNIIETGLKEGKPVAHIGGKKIAPGTIAEDLQALGIRNKDFEYVRIARTESARIQNQGALNRFKLNNITHVQVHDGMDFDAECAAANGQIWTIEYSQSHELEHPNCTRNFSPHIPDDWEPPENT